MTESEWPILGRESSTCPGCGRPVDPSAWFCEACGEPLQPSQPPPATSPAAVSGQTRRLGVRASEVTSCGVCGGTIDADGYCQTCGAKALSARDHFSEAPSEWVGGVCDRGRQHQRNEDAMALWCADDQAVLVVCDGVSTSADSDLAALAAARRGREVLVSGLTEGTAAENAETAAAALVTATAEANAAAVASTNADGIAAASTTIAAAIVAAGRIHYANLGDSRVYFLGEHEQLLLSLDDSMAQAFIAEGMPRAEAEALPRAHAITKWLGRDTEDIVPRTGVHQPTEPGWLVVCSDGLWNYASAPEELATQLAAAATQSTVGVEVARRLVEWANARGGQDNITVAVARLDAASHSPTTPS